MEKSKNPKKLLILVAGAKGAIGSTLAVAVETLKENPEKILGSLTTHKDHLKPFMADTIDVTGWDRANETLVDSIQAHGVLPDHAWKSLAERLSQITIKPAPSNTLPLAEQVAQLTADIHSFCKTREDARLVLVNLLPAGIMHELSLVTSLEALYSNRNAVDLPDLAYVLAAIMAKVPVVNFTPNEVEIPVVISMAEKNNVALSGRDGKTGQTFLKLVLASALKARHLYVNGWYSLNILGNADGLNLMNPENAAGKLVNKTDVLDEILGYSVGEKYQSPSHKVHIDYYPPRGDAKEAWDVVDFEGAFGLPMSLRLNLLGRDSILAAPMVLDLARWMAALQGVGRVGLVPELAFYYKKAVGEHPYFTFQEQITALEKLETEIGAS